MWTLLKTFCLGDMVLFACQDDWQLGSFLTKNIPMFLETVTNGTVYEPLARNDDYLN